MFGKRKRDLKPSIFQILFLLVFLPIIFVFLILYSLWIKQLNNEFIKHEKIVEKQIIERYIESTKNHVNTVVKFIDEERTERLNIIKRFSKERTLKIYGIIEDIYSKYKDKKSSSEIQSLILKRIRQFIKVDKISYVSIKQTDGICVMCSSLPALEGSNVLYMQDRNGVYVVKKEINRAIHSGGFVRYRWYNKKRNYVIERLSYVRLFKPFNWVVSSGYYIDEFDSQTKKDIVEILRNYRYGENKNNYVFIARLISLNGGDCYALGVLNPNTTRQYEGKCLSSNVKDANGNYFRRDILKQLKNKGWALVAYYYKIPDSDAFGKKISFIKIYKPWNWIVGSGFYVKDAQFATQTTMKNLSVITDDLEQKTKIAIVAIILVFFILFCIIYAIFERILGNFSREFKRSIQNKTLLDTDLVNLKEISSIVEFGNQIIELVKESEEKLNSFNKLLKEQVEEISQKLREKDAAIFQRSKYAQMGEMMSMIAHQWRQPLNAINTAVVNLQMRAMLNEEIKSSEIEECANLVQNLNRGLSQTISDFMRFFKRDNSKIEFDLKDTINKALNMIEYLFSSHKIEVVLDIKEDITILGYPQELMHIIINLVSNAKDVIIEREIKNPKIFIKAYIDNGNAKIAVEDNAGGIDNDAIDKIFNLYFTTKDESKGTGIGLYMSKMSIEKNFNGTIKAYNSESGAVFEISLPLNNK